MQLADSDAGTLDAPKRRGRPPKDRNAAPLAPFVAPAASGASASVAIVPRFHRVDILAPAFGCTDGYGTSTENMALALERLGVIIRLVGWTRQTGYITARHIFDRRMQDEAPVLVAYSQPNSWTRQIGRVGIGFSMFESDILPASWSPGITFPNEVWVPTRWQVSLFAERSGKPVHVIPLAVDGDRFTYRRRARGPILKFLHFACAGEDVRKGADLAMRAFSAAFPASRQDVSLELRSTIPHAMPRHDSRVSVCFGQQTPDDHTAYLHEFDALIYPSRGEGFGLIPLECIATGMPAIFADATGPSDYADLGLTVSATRTTAPVQYGGSWWEPSFDELVDRMREVDREYDRVMDDAAVNAALVRECWTWDRTAAAIVTRLNAQR